MSDAIFGKYRLIAELGHGGMADVFLAVIAGPAGSGFSKLTVVKRLRQNLADEPEFIEMLVDEARISARLNHPNVVQTNEVGHVGNQYFLAMEYLDGQPLHRIQHRAQQAVAKAPPGEPPPDPFPEECRYLVIADTLAGLHYAHELADYDGSPLEIVHRDVTPHNVFVTYEGQVKVVDFGIAKAAGRSSETRQGVVKGKVRYMAPEQAVGQKVDRRADVFAIGIMLWEAATGKRLWQGVDEMEIVQHLVSGRIKSSPREVKPDVPEEIDAICKKALAMKPEDRYQTADELRLAIEQFLAERRWLVTARRKLGPAVAELFKDKRSEIRSIIDRQLAALKEEDQPRSVRVSTDSSPSLSSSPASTSSASIARVTLGATTTSAATDPPIDTRRGPDRRIFLAGAGALLVVGIGIAAMARSVGSADAKAPLAASVSASAAPAAVRTVSVRLSATPAEARILVDGALVSSPFEARLPADGNIHVVRIEAKGYEPRLETIRFDTDVSFSFVLTRAAKGGDDSASRNAAAAAGVAGSGKAPATGGPAASTTAPPPAETAAATETAATAAPRPPPVVPSAITTSKIAKPTIDTSEDPWAAKK